MIRGKLEKTYIEDEKKKKLENRKSRYRNRKSNLNQEEIKKLVKIMEEVEDADNKENKLSWKESILIKNVKFNRRESAIIRQGLNGLKRKITRNIGNETKQDRKEMHDKNDKKERKDKKDKKDMKELKEIKDKEYKLERKTTKKKRKTNFNNNKVLKEEIIDKRLETKNNIFNKNVNNLNNANNIDVNTDRIGLLKKDSDNYLIKKEEVLINTNEEATRRDKLDKQEKLEKQDCLEVKTYSNKKRHSIEISANNKHALRSKIK